MSTQEQFVINDLVLNVNPTDIRVLDDDYVVEESYMRSHAVFANKSRHATSKISITLPFGVKTTEDDGLGLNSTNQYIKLITQLTTYPFCFIRSNRVQTYISPTKVSATNYLLFAVDELVLTTNCNVANMLVLEIVLVYFNYSPLINDFEFLKTLKFNNTQTLEEQGVAGSFNISATSRQSVDEAGNKYEEISIPQISVTTLKESEGWQNYFKSVVDETIANIAKLNLESVDDTNTHTLLKVDIGIPYIIDVNDTIGYQDVMRINEDSKVVTVANLNSNDDALENLYLNPDQDFSKPVPPKVITPAINPKTFEAHAYLTTEYGIKENFPEYESGAYRKYEHILANKDKYEQARKELKAIQSNPTLRVTLKEAAQQDPRRVETIDAYLKNSPEQYRDYLYENNIRNRQLDANDFSELFKGAEEKLQREFTKNSKQLFIQYTKLGLDTTIDAVVQTVTIRRKNRLAIHPIGAYKHPMVQYMGKYATEANIQVVYNNQEVYGKDISNLGRSTFLKQMFNQLDFNRKFYPEATAHNYLKIYSLLTTLFQVESFLPSQSQVIASSLENGIETVSYNFIESNMEEFLEQSKVATSGIKDPKKAIEVTTKIMLAFIDEMTKYFIAVAASTPESFSNASVIQEIYKDFLVYCKELAIEFKGSFESKGKDSYTVLNTMVDAALGASGYPEENRYTHAFKTSGNTGAQQGEAVYYADIAKNSYDISRQFQVNLLKNAKTLVSLRRVLIVENKAETDAIIAELQKQASATGQAFEVKYTQNPAVNIVVDRLITRLTVLEPSNSISKAVLQKYAAEYFNLFGTQIKAFSGQAIPDFNLERMVKTLDVNGELAAQALEPFFFLREIPLLDSSKITDTINKINKLNSNPEENISTAIELGVNQDFASVENGTAPLSDVNGVEGLTKGVFLTKYSPLEEAYYPDTLRTDAELTQLQNQILAEAMKDLPDSARNLSDSSAAVAPQTDINREQWVVLTYKLLVEEGLHPTLAKAMTAEIGRENAFIENVMFGSHKDPAGTPTNPIYNLGLISWNDPRKTQLVNHLRANGIKVTGATAAGDFKIEKTAAGLRGQLSFLVNELKTLYTKTFNKLDNLANSGADANNPNLVKILGREYIGWAYGQTTLRNGKSFDWKRQDNVRAGWLIKLNELLALEGDIKAGSQTSPTQGGQTDTGLQAGKTDAGTVLKVLDGDTFTIQYDSNQKTQNIRIYGINAPESANTYNNISTEAQVGAKESKEALINAMKAVNNRVELLGDFIGFETQGGETEARRLAKVFVNYNGKKFELALGLLEKGLAFKTDYAKESVYEKAEQIGRTKGIWTLEGIVKPARVNAVNTPRQLTNAEIQAALDLNQVARFKDKPMREGELPIKTDTPEQWTVRSPYGNRRSIKTNNGGMSSSKHQGIDLVNAQGKTGGAQVIPLVDGVVKTAGLVGSWGNLVVVQHSNSLKTVYAHLNQVLVKVGDTVYANRTILGTVGTTGNSTGDHLHYEVSINGQPVNMQVLPKITELATSTLNASGVQTLVDVRNNPEGTLVKTTLRSTPKEYSVYNEDFLFEAFKQNINTTVNRGLKTATPTIKVYVTIGNEDQDLFFNSGSQIQYYELKGVRNISINTNNDENPIDSMSLVIADPSFVNTDTFAGLHKLERIDVTKIGTDFEMQFKNDRLKLRPGMKLHVRAGYSNNPNDLDIIFNGSVISTQNLHTHAMQVVCESFGKELLSDVIGHGTPRRLGGGWNASTGTLFADAMLSPNIYHFGKTWSLVRSLVLEQTAGDATDPEAKSLLSSYQNDFVDSIGNNAFFNTNYYFGIKAFSQKSLRHRIYTNIYSADIEYNDDVFNSPIRSLLGNLFSLTKPIKFMFFAYNDTPWSIMKQMEYRHPGTIAKPLWYEDRCTMFYGTKEQMYIARDSSNSLMNLTVDSTIKDSTYANQYIDAYLNVRKDRMRPAANFHMISSNTNLISNGIKLNSEYKTQMNVSYFVDERDVDGSNRTFQSYAMQIDDNLHAWDIRGGQLNLAGCDGKYMAYRYGIEALRKECEKMYSGSIFITGQPNMKAGDYAFIEDDMLRLKGIIKIRECFHHIDEKKGFITEIVPGQYVEPAQFLRSTLFLRYGLISNILSTELNQNLDGAYNATEFRAFHDFIKLLDQLIKIKGPTFYSKYVPLPDVTALANTEDDAYVITTTSVSALFSVLMLKWGFNKIFGTAVSFKNHIPFMNLLRLTLPIGLAIPKTALALTSGTLKVTFGLLGGVGKGLRGAAPAISASVRDPNRVSNAVQGVKNLSGAAYERTAKLLSSAKSLSVSTSALRALKSISIHGLVFDLVLTLALSWVYAKVEENKYTRQPLLFYPLVRHGKMYSAGMSGVIRNSKLEALVTEGGKTWAAVKRASAILNTNRLASGKETSLILEALEGNYRERKIAPAFTITKDGELLSGKNTESFNTKTENPF